MRLKISGNRTEIRQSYIPALFPYLVKPLMNEGAVCNITSLLFPLFFNICVIPFVQGAVDEVIERMDEYCISKEDWDSLVEFGLDQYKDDFVLKKISPATKTHFTKR
jgi:replication factor C subunit 1